jgi:YegS/Rv2252/BmrU family lipid kinase
MLARDRAGAYDAVFTLGGDGTAMEVIAALAPGGPPVGILPGGTGNLMARALGTSLNVERAIRRLVTGTVARIDLGRLENGRRFAIGIGVGIDAAMIAETPILWKRRLGVLAYIIWGIRAVIQQERFNVRITADNRTIERKASAVLVANFGTVLGKLITLGDGIAYDDGVLDVCIFDPGSIWEAVRIMRKLIFRNFRPDPAIGYLTGRRIVVETAPARLVQADGDLVGETPIRVTAEPLAGCLLVPQRLG